tara:strand:+ start:341 stop:613 length:273 start_codon:yes stop_codon:yes gene_type:complete
VEKDTLNRTLTLTLWLHTLVELWAWNKPEQELVDRGASPWDNTSRRPSHADKKRAWSWQTVVAEFRTLSAGLPNPAKIQEQLWRLAQMVL